MILRNIYEEDLWKYARDPDGVLLQDYEKVEFGFYLNLFCRTYGVSRSGTYDHLRTVRIWIDVLHLDPEILEKVGIKRARPIRKLVSIDGRTGEVTLPPPEVIDKLPPGSTDLDRVRNKVMETLVEPAEPLTNSDVTKSFTVDVGAAPELFFFEDENGAIWCDYCYNEEMWSKIIVHDATMADMPHRLREIIHGKFRSERYDNGISK